jgi:3-hydroxyisobutyrate dehydrogenase-like beta-hydroxyacid dehydrogenase
MKIAFVGLGRMGFPMAGHLARAGHELTVVDLDQTQVSKWIEEHGGVAAATPAEAVHDAEFVVTSLPADAQLRDTGLGDSGILDAANTGAVWIDHTTASAKVSRELAGQAAERGVGFLDAPVSGGVDGARAGTLAVMVGGEEDSFQRAEAVLETYSARISHMGPSGSGQLTKMTNQICVVGLCQALVEGLDFAEASGLDLERVVEVMLAGASSSWEMENRWRPMAEGSYDFGFATELMRKDIGLCLAEARDAGVALPVTAIVDQFLSEVENMGGGRWDWCSLMERQRRLRIGATGTVET